MDDKTPFRWSDSSFAGKGAVVWMAPEAYLTLSPALKGVPYQDGRGKDLKASVDSGEEVNSLPSLTLKGGRVSAQDGRHRAILARDSGVKAIPVRISGDKFEPEGEITGMQGKKVKLQAPPRPWADVVKDSEFRKLPAAEREAARQQYFNDVVAPRLSTADMDEARKQFDSDTRPRRAPRDMPAPDPTEGMSPFKKFVAGYGSVVPRAGQSMLAADRDLLELHPRGKPIADFLHLPSTEDVAETNRLMKPLLESDPSVGKRRVLRNVEDDPSKPARMRYVEEGERFGPGPGASGSATGNMALAAPLALAPGASTVLGSTLYGGAYGGLTAPATSWEERGQNALATGAVSGGTTLGARALPSLYKSFISPFTTGGRERMALDALQRFAKDPNAIRNALSKPAPAGAPAVDELIPGSRATLAEVTGDPGIAQAQRSAQAATTEASNEIASLHSSRIEARKNALIRQFGIGSKEALEASREKIANREYRKAWSTPIKAKDIKENAAEMKGLLSRPSIQRARKSALELAREEEEVLTPNDLKGGSVKGLHYMKKALDGEISAAKRSGDANLSRLLIGTRKKLTDVIEKLSPSYKKANESFAKASEPINQEQIGSYLYDKLFPALSAVGAEKMTPVKFAQVLKEGNKMAKKATGFEGARLKDILTTDQWNTIINLAKDVGREVGAVERGRVPGSPTAQYLSGRNVLRQILGPVGLPETWAEKVAADMLHNRWTSLAAAPVERKVQNELALMLADPRRAVAAQQRLDTSRRGLLPRSANALTRYALPPAGVGAGLTLTENQ